MTILRALAGHYDRLVANDEAPEYGYSLEAVSFGIVLSLSGEVVDVLDLRDTSGRTLRPSRRLVPRPANRSANVVSNFLWDKTAYVLGVTSDQNSKVPIPVHRGEHAAFRQLHHQLLAGRAILDSEHSLPSLRNGTLRTSPASPMPTTYWTRTSCSPSTANRDSCTNDQWREAFGRTISQSGVRLKDVVL